MMNSDFLKRGVLLPLIAAAAVGIISFSFLAGNIDILSPFSNSSEVLRFDYEYAKGRPDGNYQSGDVIGTLSSKDVLITVYDGGYTTLGDGCSLSDKGAFFGENGTGYVEIINSNADKFGDKLTFSGDFGTYRYKKTDEKVLGSESEVFLTAPRAKQSIVVYYRQRADIGLSSSYRAIIYEGVA